MTHATINGLSELAAWLKSKKSSNEKRCEAELCIGESRAYIQLNLEEKKFYFNSLNYYRAQNSVVMMVGQLFGDKPITQDISELSDKERQSLIESATPHFIDYFKQILAVKLEQSLNAQTQPLPASKGYTIAALEIAKLQEQEKFANAPAKQSVTPKKWSLFGGFSAKKSVPEPTTSAADQPRHRRS